MTTTDPNELAALFTKHDLRPRTGCFISFDIFGKPIAACVAGVAAYDAKSPERLLNVIATEDVVHLTGWRKGFVLGMTEGFDGSYDSSPYDPVEDKDEHEGYQVGRAVAELVNPEA